MGTGASKSTDDRTAGMQSLRDQKQSLFLSQSKVKAQATLPLYPFLINAFSIPTAKCDAPLPPPPLPDSSGAPPPPPPAAAASDDAIASAASAARISIPNPGPYEQSAVDGKRLVSIDTFDGLRFDISKQLSPFMAVVHSFWLGTNMIPDGRNKTYSFIAQIADEQGLLFTRIDFDRGSVDGRIHRALLGGLCMGKLQLGLSANGDGAQDQCMAEVDFGGQTWTANLKYGSMGGGLLYGCNYFQSITPRVAMGGEGIYIAANQGLLANYTLKFNLPAPAAEQDDSSTADNNGADAAVTSTMCCNYNAGQDMLTLNYKRTVTPNRVSLAAELSCSPTSLDSQVLLGAEFKLTRSKIGICVDGEGRIQSNVEAKLGMGGAPTIQFSGELDHVKNVMRFGYGLNIDA